MINKTFDEKLLLAMTMVAIVTITPFTVEAYLNQAHIQLLINSIALIGLSGIFMGVYRTTNTDKYATMLALFLIIVLAIGVFLKGSQAVYWVYPLIVILFYLLTPTTASVISLIFSIYTLGLMYSELSTTLFIRVLASLLVINILSIIFSLSMERKNKAIERNNKALSQSHKLSQLRNEILELIVNSKDISAILKKIVLSVENEIPNSLCSILLVDSRGEKLTVGAAPSFPDYFNNAVDGVSIGRGNGICSHTAHTGLRTDVEDVQTQQIAAPIMSVAAKANLTSCWSEPIIHSEGNVLGTFAVYYREKMERSVQDYSLIEQCIHLARIAIWRKKSERIIWKQANYDSLTNLPNRNMLRKHVETTIEDALREDKQFTLALLDLNNFKEINDTLGHDIGDSILIEAARRIKKELSEHDLVARLGGDEFVIILKNMRDIFSTHSICEKLLKSLSTPYYVKQEKVYCTASIGVASYPFDARELNGLLINADQAMYIAKKERDNNVHFFNDAMHASFLQRMELIKDLHQAIKEKEFYLVYQPIVNLVTNKIIKAEALIRWEHPTKGLISPVDFIPLAEETGLISDISDWIFQEVSVQVDHWRTHFEENLQININTSPLQYKNEGKQIKTWVEQLQNRGMSAQAIGIEITENLLMEDSEKISDVLATIRHKGINISIDDFGTGYSSFSYLKEFQIDFIKIDKSFVQGMSETNNDMALCEAIIVMAKKLNILVVAEGIETKLQRELLTSAGCDYGQGYYLHRPLSKEDFEGVLRRSDNSASVVN
jgi:diguanylate cyclase (GGDEF)-like protein